MTETLKKTQTPGNCETQLPNFNLSRIIFYFSNKHTTIQRIKVQIWISPVYIHFCHSLIIKILLITEKMKWLQSELPG